MFEVGLHLPASRCRRSALSAVPRETTGRCSRREEEGLCAFDDVADLVLGCLPGVVGLEDDVESSLRSVEGDSELAGPARGEGGDEVGEEETSARGTAGR